jgi:hypothetical protein
MGHAIGFHSLDTFDATDECAMDIPGTPPDTINDICEQERQMAFFDWGDRDSLRSGVHRAHD